MRRYVHTTGRPAKAGRALERRIALTPSMTSSDSGVRAAWPVAAGARAGLVPDSSMRCHWQVMTSARAKRSVASSVPGR
jgi:hypothetical protein